VAGSAIMMFVTVGVGYYGLAVFLTPLQEEHGWSNAVVSGATGWFFAVGGVTGFLIGPAVDRHGPVRFMTVGVLLMTVAAASLVFISQAWHLYLAYTMQAIAFGLAGSVSLNAMLSRWFVTRRAQAMSITFTGVSLGGVILVPLGTALVESGGVDLAAPVLAAIVLVGALPIVLLVLAWEPESLGLEPDAGRPDTRVDNAALRDDVQRRAWTRREAMRTSSFWALTVSYVLVLLAQTGFLLHQIAYLETRLGSRSAAAFALSTTAFGSIVARLIVGAFADKLDKRLLTAAIFALQGIAVLATTWVDNRVATYVLVLIVGFTIGNVYMMQSLITAEIFGLVSLGTIFGIMALTSQVGSGFGPFLVGWAEDITGSYDTPFAITGIVTLVSAVIVLFARPVPLPAATLPSATQPSATSPSAQTTAAETTV